MILRREEKPLSCRALMWKVSFLVAASSGPAFAGTVDCAILTRQMDRSRIRDVAVAVFDRGKVESVFCNSSGANLSADSIFEAASLSKPVFAAGVLQLVQEHRLDLDRPLTDYLGQAYEHQQNPFGHGPADTVNDPRFARITARMVLSHTSGLPNWSHHGPLSFLNNPGETWSYSGEGYVYLQRVVESITGQPIDTFLKYAVLLPLGMTRSSFVWQADFEATALPGHAKDGLAASIDRFSRPVVSTTLYTTLGDYSRFVSHLLHPSRQSPFAMEEERQVMVRRDLSLYWGLGVAIEQVPAKSYFHWGANPGFQSFFLCQPKTGRGVLFFTDSDRGLDLVDTLVHATVPGVHPILRFPMLHPKG